MPSTMIKADPQMILSASLNMRKFLDPLASFSRSRNVNLREGVHFQALPEFFVKGETAGTEGTQNQFSMPNMNQHNLDFCKSGHG